MIKPWIDRLSLGIFLPVLLFAMTIVENADAQFSFVGPTIWTHPGPGPGWGPPPPHWGPPPRPVMPPFAPYQTVPPYPGALPLYYYRNIPIYDYTMTNFVARPLAYPVGINARVTVQTRSAVDAIAELAQATRVVRSNSTPHQIEINPAVVPQDSRYAALRRLHDEQIQAHADQVALKRRTWRTVDGDVIVDGQIFGLVDDTLGIRTADGHRFYINPNRLDDESYRAFELWKAQR